MSFKESEKRISKDGCSHVTFMEMSLSAGGGAQGPLAFPNAIEAACGSQNNKTMWQMRVSRAREATLGV